MAIDIATKPAGRRPQKKRASAETIAKIGLLFRTTELAQAEIGRICGVSVSSVRHMARRRDWRRPVPAEGRWEMVGAIRSRVDAEIADVERILKGGDADASAGMERGARTLASLMRTLREIVKFDEDQARAARSALDAGEAETRADDHDAVPDPDALREALAARLDALRREREAR